MNLKTGQSVHDNILRWSLYSTLLLYGLGEGAFPPPMHPDHYPLGMTQGPGNSPTLGEAQCQTVLNGLQEGGGIKFERTSSGASLN